MSKFIVIGILLIGLLLRIQNYQHQPPRGASSDEYTYTFLGMSLLQKGVPTSWSYLPGYEKRDVVKIDNIIFPLVTPYFDHPPLNGILVGGWALLHGEDTFSKVKISTIRQVPIVLGLVSSFLVYLLALKVYGKKTAIWALLIYTTSTIIAMETRTVFAENLLTPLLLLSLLIIVNIRKQVSIKQILLLSLLSGLSFWAKELGVIVFLSTLTLLFLLKTRKRELLIFTVLSVLLMSTYLLYGYIYNWHVFTQVVLFQGTRAVGPNTLYMLLFHPIIVNKLYYDGWYFIGFLSFFFAFTKFEKNKLFLIPSFIYFFLLLFSLTKEGEMGWYMIPLFPMFSIFTASQLTENIKEKGWYIFVVSLFVGMYIVQYRIEAKYGLTSSSFRAILMLIFAPLFVSYILKKWKTYSFISNMWFYALIVGTILITYRYIHPL